MQTAIVALFSGIIATGLFLYARQRARNSYELSAVDATQASEVIFALIGEMLFLQSDAPTVWGYVGIALTLIGLCLYIRAQAVSGPLKMHEKWPDKKSFRKECFNRQMMQLICRWSEHRDIKFRFGPSCDSFFLQWP